MKENKTLWIARDKDNHLGLFSFPPDRLKNVDKFSKNYEIYELEEEDYPEVAWENSPQQVELKLKER